MAKKMRMIRRPRKARKRPAEPNILERLKRLSDNAPVAELRDRGSAFYNDSEDIKYKDK